ncbi:MAG TPA: hypothetical protein VLW17_09095, partial [Thermoanaerobaculaceae bacterium]|nr:hypothetical protein [Thermoanaerobaculaceae bacterium]
MSPTADGSGLSSQECLSREMLDAVPVTHWVSHYDRVPGTINDDHVGEAGIDGTASAKALSSQLGVAYVSPAYYPSLAVDTLRSHYYDATSCTYG